MATSLAQEIEIVQAGRYAQDRLGKLIRAWRINRDLTQGELARRLGITPQALCDVELGRRALGAQKLARLQGLLQGGK